jgi:hypothetical protein
MTEARSDRPALLPGASEMLARFFLDCTPDRESIAPRRGACGNPVRREPVPPSAPLNRLIADCIGIKLEDGTHVLAP